MQTDAELAHVLLGDFNDYRGRTQRHHELRATKPFMAKPLKATNERIQLFVELITWCRSRHLEPRAWVHGLFRVRNWVHPPSATKGCLMSERLIPKIKRLPTSGVLKHRVRLTGTPTDARDDIDPNRDVIPGVEAMKKNLVMRGMATSCLTQIESTLGYHPKSETCVACPLAQDCALQLVRMFKFDIIGLRLGTITAAQAEEVARRG